MKEKISREEFFKLKEEIVKSINEAVEIGNQNFPESIDRNAENYEELRKEFYADINRRMKEKLEIYAERMKELTSYNLSEIPSEDWRDVLIFSNKKPDDDIPEIRIDFSDTFTNFDFSITQVSGDNFDFNSCSISNLENVIGDIKIPVSAYDKRTIDANSDLFISTELPEDVQTRFYDKKSTLRDIITYEEIFNKANGHMNYPFSRDEFQKFLKENSFEDMKKIDLELVELLEESWYMSNVIEKFSEKENVTVDDFNKFVVEEIREEIIKSGPDNNKEYPEKFRKANPDLIFREENPELFDEEDNRLRYIDLKTMYEYSESLKGKKFTPTYQVQTLYRWLGEDITDALLENLTYEQAKFLSDEFSRYSYAETEKAEKISEKLLSFEPVERSKILKSLAETDMGKRVEVLSDFTELEKVMDIEDVRFVELDSRIKEIGVQNFIKAGLSNVNEVKALADERELEKIKQYIDNIDISFFIPDETEKTDVDAIRKFGIDFYIDRDCSTKYDVITLRSNGINLDEIKEAIDSGIELDAFFKNSNVVSFINTFGIENVMRLNEESENIFYSSKGTSSYLLNTIAENYSKIEDKQEFLGEVTYEDFVDEIAKVIRFARENKNNTLEINKFSDKVKEKIPEEFLSKRELENVLLNLNPNLNLDTIVSQFSQGILGAELIKQNPELIQILKDKNLVSAMKINGLIKTGEEKVVLGDGTESGEIKTLSERTNIVKYLSDKLGTEGFLEICEKYGRYLDRSNILITGEESKEEILEIVDKGIYDVIKNERERFSHENVSDDFKQRHPELFLDYEVDEYIKGNFYTKSLGIEYLKSQKVRDALDGKDLQVGANIYFSNNREIEELYKNLSREDFYTLIDEYGKYLEGARIYNIQNILTQSENPMEDLKKELEKKIEENVLSRRIYIDDNAPQFLKDKYPQYFIEGLEKDDRDRYYALRGQANLKRFYNIFSGEKLKFFEGKDLTINFPNAYKWDDNAENYKDFFEKFPEEILGIFSNYGEGLDRIISMKKTDLFEKAYRKYGELALKSTELICALTSEDELEKVNFSNYQDLIKKSNFHLNRGYQRINAERLVAKMYLFLGYDNTAEFFKLPEMSREELVRAIDERENEFDEACEVRFSLKGDIQIVTEMFRKLDLTEYQNGNKKIQMEIFKNINMNLETGFEGSLEELLADSISKVGAVPNQGNIHSLERHLNSILTSQKMEKINPYLNTSINANLTATGANRKIITDTLILEMRKNILENSNINQEQLIENLRKEILDRTREDGTPYYSPQVRNHFNEIETTISKFLENEEVNKIISRSTIDCLKTERQRLGNGWIRRVLNVPTDLSLEEIENLEQRLYGTEEGHESIEFDKRVIVKSKNKTEGKENPEEKAYSLLENLENPLIITMSKAEIIFDRIKQPYSKDFVEFLMANRKEILEKPEMYTRIPQLHEIFDATIQRREVRNRYDRGTITVEQMFDFVENDDRPYGLEKEGDWELSKLSRGSSLDSRKFEIAQKLLSKMKAREFQTVPNVKGKSQGKYRGRILRSDDPLHLVVGDITTCCQHIGGYGETSMLHSALEKNGGLFVVEELDEFGNVVNTVAQSWTWRNNDTVCFDNIEIPDTLKPKLSNNDYEEITKVYQETAKAMIKTDAKLMKKLLDEGKITQEQYDELVVKQVTVGLGCNDLKTLETTGKFQRPKKRVLPVEGNKSYPEDRDPEGEGQVELYTDASSAYVFAQIADLQDEIEQMPDMAIQSSYKEDKIENIPVGYDKTREVLSHKGKEINPDDIRAMEKISKSKVSSESYRFEGLGLREDIAEELNVNSSELRLLISRDEDWYILSTENSEYIQIESAVKTLPEEKKDEKTVLADKISGLEMASGIYDLMLESDKKNKVMMIMSDYDSSGINLEALQEKGLITITESQLKKVIQVTDREKLEEESRKIKEMLEKQEELLMIQGKVKKQEGQDGQEEKEDKNTVEDEAR